MLVQSFGVRLLPAFLAAAIVLLVGAAAAPAQEMPVVGQVGRVVGEVNVLRGTERLPAVTGTALQQGDAIATGPQGRAEVVVSDGSTVTLGAGTTLSLASLTAPASGPGQAFLDLIEGILRIALSGERPWHSFEVRSATAVASVRSTDWIIDATRVKTGVFVVDGRVAVTGREGAGEVTLTPGQGTDVLIGGLPGAPKTWGQARVDDVLARTQLP